MTERRESAGTATRVEVDGFIYNQEGGHWIRYSISGEETIFSSDRERALLNLILDYRETNYSIARQLAATRARLEAVQEALNA